MHSICSMIKTMCGIDEAFFFLFSFLVFLFTLSRVTYVMISLLIAMYFLNELRRERVKNKEGNKNIYMKVQRSYNFMLSNV